MNVPALVIASVLVTAGMVSLAPERLLADPADDLLVFEQITRHRLAGEFEEALGLARRLLDEKHADPNGTELEIRFRTTLVRTLEMLAGLPETAREEMAAAERLEREGHRSRGDYVEAERIAREVLEIRRRYLGESHYDVATSLNILALSLMAQGRLREAEPLFFESLRMYREIVGENSSACAMAHSTLASLYSELSDYARAEEHFRRSLHLFREYHSENEAHIAMMLGNLGVIVGTRGDPAAAEPLLRESLRIRKKVHEPDHPSIALSLNLLGSNLSERGRLDEAERLYREALRIRRKAFEGDHPSVAVSTSNVAGILRRTGELEESAELYRETLEMRRRLFGNEHPKVGKTLSDLGTVRLEQGDVEAAEAMQREALANQVAVYGERHPAVAQVQRRLGETARARGDLARARATFESALASFEEVFGPRHPEVTRTLVQLGNLHLMRGEHAEAVPVFRRAVDSYEHSRVALDAPVEQATFQESPDLHLAVALLESDRAEEAFEFVERYHGRVLVDLLSGGDERDPLPRGCGPRGHRGRSGRDLPHGERFFFPRAILDVVAGGGRKRPRRRFGVDDLVAEFSACYGGIPRPDDPWHLFLALALRAGGFGARDRLNVMRGVNLALNQAFASESGNGILKARVLELEDTAFPYPLLDAEEEPDA